MQKVPGEKKWFIYIVKCKDETLYTGITKDLKRRVHEHNSTLKGAKSIRFKRPVLLVYFEEYNTHLEAARREVEIKSWKRVRKLKLISSRVGIRPLQGVSLRSTGD